MARSMAQGWVALGISIFFSMSVHAENLRERLAGFSVGAHQGGAYTFNANTIKRFKTAKDQGVDLIETDLHLTKDGEVIVYHDDKLNTWTNCKGNVSDLTL